MKRVLFIFISLMICVCGYSQKHMKFQNIEIDGKNEWESWFETDEGEILLAIKIRHDFEDNTGSITIMYLYKANNKKNQNMDIGDNIRYNKCRRQRN